VSTTSTTSSEVNNLGASATSSAGSDSKRQPEALEETRPSATTGGGGDCQQSGLDGKSKETVAPPTIRCVEYGEPRPIESETPDSKMTRIHPKMEATDALPDDPTADLIVGAFVYDGTPNKWLSFVVMGHLDKRRFIHTVRVVVVATGKAPLQVSSILWDHNRPLRKSGTVTIMDFNAPLAAAHKLSKRFSIFVQLLDKNGDMLVMAERYMTEGDGQHIEYHGCHPRGVVAHVMTFVPECLCAAFRQIGVV
jgi:hypothetical protein